MRLFVALEAPAGVRAELEQRIDRLRRTAPMARWVRSEGLHLTLLFVGELSAALLPDLQAALTAAFERHPPLTLAVAGAGCFPSPARARVLWCGLAEQGEREQQGRLAALQRDVATAGEPFVERPDDRPFHAHLTVARCQPPWPRPAADRFVERFAPPAGEPFTVVHGVLIESVLAPGGSRYTALAELPLSGVAA